MVIFLKKVHPCVHNIIAKSNQNSMHGLEHIQIWELLCTTHDKPKAMVGLYLHLHTKIYCLNLTNPTLQENPRIKRIMCFSVYLA